MQTKIALVSTGELDMKSVAAEPYVNGVTVQSTTNYSMFRYSMRNRPIDSKHLTRLITAIQRKNLLQDNPIKIDDKGYVVDGQHRLEAAKHLKLPIYYQTAVVMTVEDAPAINGPVKKWTSEDYFAIYCEEGRPEYLKLREFKRQYPWLKTRIAATLTYYGDRTAMEFEAGLYKCNDIDFAHEVCQALLDFSKYVPYYQEDTFIAAVKHLLEHAEYDHRQMINKLKFCSSMLRKCTNSLDYLKVFETIYNYKAKEGYRAHFERLFSGSPRRRPDRIRRNTRTDDK